MDEVRQTVAAGGPAVDNADAARARSRRDFLRAAGLGGAALAAAACGGVEGALVAPAAPGTPNNPTPAVVGPGGSVTLDFSNELDVLNYAFALEQLEAAFYTQVVAAPGFNSIFAPNERRVLTDLRDHEIVHREFFAAALGTARIPNLTPRFGAVNFGDRASVLQTARTFEDLGVSAYNGAARFLKSAVYLTLAGKIVSVEARHASAIRDLLAPRSADFAPNAYDVGMTPQNVLTAAAPFIVESISVTNA